METFPFSNGALYKFEINGKTVYGKKNVSKYVFDDWEQYLSDGQDTLDIKVFYGEKNEVNNRLDNLSAENEDKGGNCACAGASSLVSLLGVLGAAFLLVLRKRG